MTSMLTSEKDRQDVDEDDESLQRALADLEMVMAAYPDETSIISSSSSDDNNSNHITHAASATPTCFPLQFRLHMSIPSCYFDLIMRSGYPTMCNIEIASMRCNGKNAENKERMEAAATAIRNTARMCLAVQGGDDGDDDENKDGGGGGGGQEGALACCAAAMEAWNNHTTTTAATPTTTVAETSHDHHLPMDKEVDEDEYGYTNTQQQHHEHCFHFESSNNGINNSTRNQPSSHLPLLSSSSLFPWIIGSPLVDRKSTFLAHACHVSCEADVKIAIQQLLDSHSKYRRATHNMVIRKK
jgi:Uncharacterized protein family UPF0029